MLRAYLPQLVDMQGFREAWGDVVEVSERGLWCVSRGDLPGLSITLHCPPSVQVLRSVLSAGRKGASSAATALIAALVQV